MGSNIGKEEQCFEITYKNQTKIIKLSEKALTFLPVLSIFRDTCSKFEPVAYNTDPSCRFANYMLLVRNIKKTQSVCFELNPSVIFDVYLSSKASLDNLISIAQDYVTYLDKNSPIFAREATIKEYIQTQTFKFIDELVTKAPYNGTSMSPIWYSIYRYLFILGFEPTVATNDQILAKFPLIINDDSAGVFSHLSIKSNYTVSSISDTLKKIKDKSGDKCTPNISDVSPDVKNDCLYIINSTQVIDGFNRYMRETTRISGGALKSYIAMKPEDTDIKSVIKNSDGTMKFWQRTTDIREFMRYEYRDVSKCVSVAELTSSIIVPVYFSDINFGNSLKSCLLIGDNIYLIIVNEEKKISAFLVPSGRSSVIRDNLELNPKNFDEDLLSLRNINGLIDVTINSFDFSESREFIMFVSSR